MFECSHRHCIIRQNFFPNLILPGFSLKLCSKSGTLNVNHFPNFHSLPQGRFPFDDSDDDMFGDLDMRARMNRIGGFDWGGHKRAGGGTGFPDADAFFNRDFGFAGAASPQFDSAFNRAKTGAAGARKPPTSATNIPQQPTAAAAAAAASSPSSSIPMATDRSAFYDHLPDEFRQYFPESFGHSFPRMRAHQQMAAQSPPTGSFMRQHFQQPQPQQQQPQQQFHHQPQQQQPQQQQQQQPQQQTAASTAKPKLCDAAIQTDSLPVGNELHQPTGLRNTVDMGQQSRHSDGSADVTDRAHSAPPPNDAYANTGTSMTPQTGQQQANQQQFCYPQPAQAQQKSPPPTTTGERTVPIFVEGRSGPNAKTPPQPPQRAAPPQQQQPSRPTPFVGVHSGEQQQPPMADGGAEVPQTPHTADCIEKIQKIQTDVLDLMAAVDRFGGCRGDKDYKYIDEMLTRNLLKLDTIDTQGRENIRLARKEAIRCIQASITVLEAKAEQNSNRVAAAKAAADENPNVASGVIALPPADSSEQSLADKLAMFERRSVEREETLPVAVAVDERQPTIEDCGPETHVSEVQFKLKPVARTD